jgi:hypothetical protein
MALDAALRARREAFVTGHAGTTAAETLAAALTLPAGVLLHRMLVAGAHSPASSTPARVAAELATVAGPVLLGCTLLAPHLGALLFACVLAAQVVDLARMRQAPAGGGGSDGGARLAGSEGDRAAAARRVAAEPRKTFVTNFRAGMMLGTVVAILGVDFPVFPRRFAKTEAAGTSLMDLGVGGVVFASALVSRQARALAARGNGGGRSAPPPSLRDALATLSGAASAAAPLVVVGGGRTAVHAALNLPLHVSEYGVQWNFFFTVAAVTVACAAGEAVAQAASAIAARSLGTRSRVLRAVTKAGGGVRATAGATAALAAAICVAYQRWLAGPAPAALLAASTPGSGSVNATAQDAILTGGRPEGSFFAQNREGLAGVPGFTAIYLLGLAGGTLLLDGRTAGNAAYWRHDALTAGGGVVAAAWATFAAATHAYGPPSRRLTNAPYVAWVAAVCGSVLWALAAVELLTVLPSDFDAAVGSRGGGSSGGGGSRAQQRLVALADAAAATTGAVEDGVPDNTAAEAATTRQGTRPSRGGGRRGSKSPARRSPAAVVPVQPATPPAAGGSPSNSTTWSPPPGSVAFLEAINANFFASFMGANLLTGAFNAAVSTLDTPDGAAVIILAAYVAAVTGGATWLAARGVALKFW